MIQTVTHIDLHVIISKSGMVSMGNTEDLTTKPDSKAVKGCVCN